MLLEHRDLCRAGAVQCCINEATGALCNSLRIDGEGGCVGACRYGNRCGNGYGGVVGSELNNQVARRRGAYGNGAGCCVAAFYCR